MESNGRKRSRGFMKGKQLVMSIYRGANNYRSNSSSKVKPSPAASQPDHHRRVEFIVNQEQVVPHQQKQKVSFLLPADQVAGGGGGGGGGGDQYSYGLLHDNINKLYSAVAVDESVDIKAATYISSVRERLRLHRVNSEHKKLQDQPA